MWNVLSCAKGTTTHRMRSYDAGKISTNLTYLAEKTINTELLIKKLVERNLLDDKDCLRISEAPDYNHTLEVYCAVIRKGHHAFRDLLECLSQSGNEVVVEKLDPQSDFDVIRQAFKKHWRFTSVLLITQSCGFLYWMYRSYEYYFTTSAATNL